MALNGSFGVKVHGDMEVYYVLHEILISMSYFPEQSAHMKQTMSDLQEPSLAFFLHTSHCLFGFLCPVAGKWGKNGEEGGQENRVGPTGPPTSLR